MKFYIKTYGCQMNERDADAAAALLMKRGFSRAARESTADIVIVNTCSVRGKAEDKAVGKLRLLVRDRGGENAGQLIGAMGCMAQRLKEDIFVQVPGLDFSVGTHRLACLPAVIAKAMEGRGRPVLDIAEEDCGGEDVCGHTPGGISAFVNILFGCNRGCSYCVVPEVRGREWSRPGPSIVEEVAELARAGTREITLLGQSVMSYGRANEVWPDGHKSPRSFHEPLPRLLEAINDIDGLARVRFTSGHPSGCTPELGRAMKELELVCEHLHIPVQSGSDRILRLMRRGYTVDIYRDAVRTIRTAVPGIAITTDIIVGFPGETMEEFEMTRSLLREIPFDNSFIFKYSPRPGTEAEKAMADDIPASEKMRRNKLLLKDQEAVALSINEEMVGLTVEVLVEGIGRKSFSRWSGRTRTGKIVAFEPEDGVGRGDLVRVNITRAMPYTLYGKIV
ncbi:MAG: tRNA (N6-isopentenyl adenosine(37)-C2)-methylthiotransferase MiaB [Verrucomicrobia bacterium]|nr:tRNA (N6-isopentenyl adenosine(37)-C2)-methylthiotransferase MiaB [Verrucomicrobiota bacterium]